MSPNHFFKRFIKYLKFYKLDITIVMLALTCVSASLLALGSSFRQLIDGGLKQNYLYSVDYSILIIVVLIIIFSIASFFRSYFINNVAEKVINQIKIEAYNNIINFTISSFEELKIGDIISRLTVDIELLFKMIVNFLSFFLRNFLILIGGIILMFLHSSKLALIVSIIIPLLLFPLIQFSKYVRNLTKKLLVSQADIAASLEESITNIMVIQAFNQQHQRAYNFNQQIFDYLTHSSKRFKIRSSFFALSISFILFTITMVIWIGSRDILYATLTPGQMVSFIYYAIVSGVSGAGILELLSEIHLSIAAAERIFFLIDPNKQETTNQTYSSTDLIYHSTNPSYYSITKNKRDNYSNTNSSTFIEFENVSFAYSTRLDSLVFSELSFRVDKDKFIGIVGRSGAGKSTILKLLLKFYYPIKGTIKIVGQDIAKSNTQQIRQLMGYVPQDSSIFSGTIRSNIAFVKPNATTEEIMQVVDITGLTNFVRDLKKGLDTEIGEKGIRLSGGQKQRIAISRALLYNPEILLLDEAMSALDNESEQELLNKLQKVMNGKIILSIAHRISSIEHADKILIIDHGKLISGTHEKLLKTSQIYKDFSKEQLIN